MKNFFDRFASETTRNEWKKRSFKLHIRFQHPMLSYILDPICTRQFDKYDFQHHTLRVCIISSSFSSFFLTFVYFIYFFFSNFYSISHIHIFSRLPVLPCAFTQIFCIKWVKRFSGCESLSFVIFSALSNFPSPFY